MMGWLYATFMFGWYQLQIRSEYSIDILCCRYVWFCLSKRKETTVEFIHRKKKHEKLTCMFDRRLTVNSKTSTERRHCTTSWWANPPSLWLLKQTRENSKNAFTTHNQVKYEVYPYKWGPDFRLRGCKYKDSESTFNPLLTIDIYATLFVSFLHFSLAIFIIKDMINYGPNIYAIGPYWTYWMYLITK